MLGSLKLIFITMLIVMMVILCTMTRTYLGQSYLGGRMLIQSSEIARSNAYYDTPIGTKCSYILTPCVISGADFFLPDWSSPFGFFNDYYNVRDESQTLQRTIQGSVGTFIGMWYVRF